MIIMQCNIDMGFIETLTQTKMREIFSLGIKFVSIVFNLIINKQIIE